MDSVVAHFALDSGWADKVLEFGEEAVDQCGVTDGLHAWNMCAGCFGQGRDGRDSVQCAAVPAVCCEAEMREEVHADDGMCDVGHHEPPREILA
jgi:hypothetical protein